MCVTYIVTPQQIHRLIDFREVGVRIDDWAYELVAAYVMSLALNRAVTEDLRRVPGPVQIVSHYIEPVNILFDCHNVKVLQVPVA